MELVGAVLIMAGPPCPLLTATPDFLPMVTGACVSCIPSLSGNGAAEESRWYAILLYFCSNIPMACSAVYKVSSRCRPCTTSHTKSFGQEKNFNDVILDVWYLTQWVSIYQFLVSFLFMPALLVPGHPHSNPCHPYCRVERSDKSNACPGFGSKDGMTWHEVSDHDMSPGSSPDVDYDRWVIP